MWNPVQKKALKNRPEERVRLRVIEYLLEAGWSKHRISTEEGITSAHEKKLRTDLICYTHKFEPFLLVECKAGAVKITEKTADQIAHYNHQINAPFLLMTNGRADLWYLFEDEKQPILKYEIPKPFRNSFQPKEKPFSYWAERGFAGKKAAPKLRTWLTDLLNCSLQNSDNPELQYLSFKKKLNDLELNHYYHIHSSSEQRVALGFIATYYGGTRLIGVFNKNGKNAGVLEINLDLLSDGGTPNASFYSTEGHLNITIQNYIDWNEKSFHFTDFSKQAKNLFDELNE